MGIYYQKFENKSLNYNSVPYFYCPEAIKEMKANPDDRYKIMGNIGGKHSDAVMMGKNLVKLIEKTGEETPEGRLTTTKQLFYQASKKQPPICKCGLPMEIRYTVWYNYTDPKAKINRVGGLAFRMANKDKTYWTKYFRTRKAREKFWDKFIAKKRKEEKEYNEPFEVRDLRK
jgi:hypothetical protein